MPTGGVVGRTRIGRRGALTVASGGAEHPGDRCERVHVTPAVRGVHEEQPCRWFWGHRASDSVVMPVRARDHAVSGYLGLARVAGGCVSHVLIPSASSRSRSVSLGVLGDGQWFIVVM